MVIYGGAPVMRAVRCYMANINLDEFWKLRNKKRSLKFIADWMGMPYSTLRINLRRQAVNYGHIPHEHVAAVSKMDILAREKFGYATMSELVAWCRETKTIKQTAAYIGISWRTVQKHIPAEIKGLYYHHPGNAASLPKATEALREKKKRFWRAVMNKDDCQINILFYGSDCKERGWNISDWCENCKRKYAK